MINIKEYLDKIKSLAKDLGTVKLMEVCGGHTNTIVKYGIQELLPENIKLISGPGCPVCVTSQKDIDSVIELSLNKVKIATYGDMINVPGTRMSLKDAQAEGADIQIIYSTDQIKDDRVFFAVGFETTTPMTAKLLKNNVKVFSSHKTMPEAMRFLKKNMDIQGFILPGHVSTITGSEMWNQINLDVPQVISGFNPEQMIRAITLLLEQIKQKKNEIVNDYPEVVTKKGNVLAQELIKETMQPCSSEWRGIGNLENSGLEPKDDKLNARLIYKDLIKNIKSKENPACRCGDVIKGLIEPKECSLFGKVCIPSSPQGACMVSKTEGACAIAYQYKK